MLRGSEFPADDLAYLTPRGTDLPRRNEKQSISEILWNISESMSMLEAETIVQRLCIVDVIARNYNTCPAEDDEPQRLQAENPKPEGLQPFPSPKPEDP